MAKQRAGRTDSTTTVPPANGRSHQAPKARRRPLVPGAHSQAMQAERERYVPRGVYTYHPIYPATGSGARITDLDGNSFLDFAGGIGTMNVGHSHPAVIAAIRD